MEMPKYIVFRVDVMRKGTSVELTNITDEVEDVILKADRKDEPQTDYKKWTPPPKVDLPTVNTTCVTMLASALEDEPQTERSE